MTTMIRTILLSLLFISNTSAKSIHYDLSMSEPHTHLFEVEMRLEGEIGRAHV